MMAVSNTSGSNADGELSQVHSRTTEIFNKEQPQQPGSKPPPTHYKEASAHPPYARPTANSSARKLVSKPRSSSTDSSFSSLRSQAHFRYSPTMPGHFPEAAATDPEHTTRLWKTVMANLDGTKAPRREGRATPSATGSVTSESTSLSIRTKKKRVAKITDVDFIDTILEPHGITIQDEEDTDQDPITHFSILEMPRGYQLRLEVYRGKFELDVWLEPNIEHIQREYKAMRAYSCNEAEYQTFALSNIFLDEPRHPDLPEDGGDKRWLPIRMVQFVRKLPQSKWLPPPPIPGWNPPKRYDWDIRPDCTYHVSLQAFQPGFRSNVRRHVSVVQQRAFCPYLTIQFKKDEENLDTARYQVAVSSAMSLYNRYLLKSLALQASGDSWLEEDQSQMRHYGITFTGSDWNLWCTVPKTFAEWTGCTMSSICSADCRTLAGIQQLVELLNDIHYWGLEVHGKSCKRDIHVKSQSNPSADTRGVSL
ncbi:hypothetical protein F4859DRAFT_351288 [Xylaria cf. heliscus]|nr:hypothetical protein F4859DRAFT_351288 [Xylaria cf. heliscus]